MRYLKQVIEMLPPVNKATLAALMKFLSKVRPLSSLSFFSCSLIFSSLPLGCFVQRIQQDASSQRSHCLCSLHSTCSGRISSSDRRSISLGQHRCHHCLAISRVSPWWWSLSRSFGISIFLAHFHCLISSLSFFAGLSKASLCTSASSLCCCCERRP